MSGESLLPEEQVFHRHNSSGMWPDETGQWVERREFERLRAALNDLHDQVERFCAEQGEWEFYTGPTLAALGKSKHEVHERDLQKLISGDSHD